MKSSDRLWNGMQVGDWCPVGGIRGDGRPGTLFFGNKSLQLLTLFSFEAWNFPSETVCCRYASIETRLLGDARVPEWRLWRIRIISRHRAL
jgi:hypothetical protein